MDSEQTPVPETHPLSGRDSFSFRVRSRLAVTVAQPPAMAAAMIAPNARVASY